MAKRFSDKTVLITGASDGIGLVCAQRFAAEGAQVITAQRRDCEGFTTIHTDLGDPTAIAALAARVTRDHGRLDVLCNNAGVMIEAPVANMSLRSGQHCLDINLTAPFLLIQKLLPLLRAARGAIVNIASVEARGANPNHAAYCASKAGLGGLTRAVAIDEGARGVRCNAVSPGWIDTALNLEMIAARSDPDSFRANLGKIHPLGRTGQSAEVARTVAFLASDEASFISGEEITVDGGRTAKLSLPL